MNSDEVIARQRQERAHHLNVILQSKSKKKLIVAGAGTGKTFIFGKLLEQQGGDNNLALTFIRKLVNDMAAALGGIAEVKTFHAYCKKILHANNGRVELAPFLTKIIQRDAELLGKNLDDFDNKLRTLQDNSAEISFFLRRGDYYEVVGFDDSVYRLYRELRKNLDILPEFDQIVVDEYQDFNPLEVAFIEELAKKGDILIVGDDDQALYDDRSASPSHLRHLYAKADFAKFELPFCSRCPDVVVTATNEVIKAAQQQGLFEGRIPKRYECYLEDKQVDSTKYPNIILATCTTVRVIAKYIQREVAAISPEDIAESHAVGNVYPTVLVVGPAHYLREMHKYLAPTYPQISYAPTQEIGYDLVEAYEYLLCDEESNFGWRILLDLLCGEEAQKQALTESEAGKPIVSLLDPSLVAKHRKAIGLIRSVREHNQVANAIEAELRTLLDAHADAVLAWLAHEETGEQPPLDKTKPSILFTSYKGCKGLSAGHVFITGIHDMSLPRDRNNIRDVEVSQFIVALTRTRKQCHLLANMWFIAPVDGNREYVQRFEPSPFTEWIPKELVQDKGELKAKDLQ